MRHQQKRHRIGRGHSHRKATLAALGNALIRNKRITTTEPKARALRVYIEPILTRAKDDTSHNRRQVFRRLQDKETVTTLFTEISERIGDREGGYTRVVKLGQRAGDGAPMAIIELVDYNDVRPDETGAGRKRTRRGSTRRRGPAKKTEAQEAQPAAAKAALGKPVAGAVTKTVEEADEQAMQAPDEEAPSDELVQEAPEVAEEVPDVVAEQEPETEAPEADAPEAEETSDVPQAEASAADVEDKAEEDAAGDEPAEEKA